MNPPSSSRAFPPQDSASTPPEHLWRILATALGLTLLSNFLLWPAVPGFSWGLFLAATSAALVLNRPRCAWNRTSVVLLGLLMVTACQSALEISFSNVLVSLVLLTALVGELSYPALASGWERESEALWAFAKAPGRWGCPWHGDTWLRWKPWRSRRPNEASPTTSRSSTGSPHSNLCRVGWTEKDQLRPVLPLV